MAEARRVGLRCFLAGAMVAVGVLHFVSTGFFVGMVPAALPAPEVLVAVSGVFEVLGGVGLLVPRARRAASLGLALLYIAVFPANINMVVHPELGHGVPVLLLWARLPLQFVFIAWALYVGRDGAEGRPHASTQAAR
jgi:uncharacterized membrane protein